jgi:uncharacterized membrane protein
MKKLAFILVLCFVLTLPAVALAGTAFDIEQYDVDIVVNENATYNVDEKIDTNYHTPSLGMYRKIDLRPEAVFEHDGNRYSQKYRVYVNDATVYDEPFTTYEEDGWFVFETGDDTNYIEGEHLHHLSYLYDAGDDGFGDFDQFYFNIIGNEWETPINGVSFRITMPKEFDSSNVGFSVGRKGLYGYDTGLLDYKVDGT